MNDLEAYVIFYFGHLMTAIERRVHRHLLSGPITEADQRLRDGIAWEEASGRGIDEKLESLLRELNSHSGLSDDPEVLRLANGGLEVFYERTAKRILSEDRDRIFINNCSSCGALARTPKALQCRFCGHDWHSRPAT